MSVINDVRRIIKPINNIDDNLNMDNILENLIVHNNTIYNSFIFNHIIYSNKNDEMKKIITNIIKRHLDSNIKNQRIHFRNQNKKNKLSVIDFNMYFDNIYKLISKLNGMFQHIIPNNIDSDKKWGNSSLWYYAINVINNILINDSIFKSSINNINSSKNSDIYRLNYYINIFSKYINSTDFYSKFVENIDISLIEYIDTKNTFYKNSIKLSNNSVDINIININIFKTLHKYYMDCNYNYYYITKNNPFNKLKEYITENIKKIFQTNDITFIKHFLITYLTEFISLAEHINIDNILSSFSPVNNLNYISYCCSLYEVSLICNNNKFNKFTIKYIENSANKYINTFEDIMYLADLINTDIINKTLSHIYYTIGNIIKNKDEFIFAISQKLMERIIYTNVDINVEELHVSLLSIFGNSALLKYKTILYDYRESIKFSNDTCKFIITSLDAWKINHSTGYTNKIINTEEFTSILCNKMFVFNNQTNTNIEKRLIFYPHIGSVDIEIFNRSITVLPAHMFCLELFISFDTILPYDLVFKKVKQNMTNYTDVFIKSIIDSLIGTILIKKPDNTLRITTNLKNDTTIINMIEIFHNMNNTKQAIFEEIKEELCHERETIIMANVNHFIKTIDEIITGDLYDLVKKNIKQFDVDIKLFSLTLYKMKKYDYIEVNNNYVKKIVY